MNVLRVEGFKALKIGVPKVDDAFPGFRHGDFAVIYGGEAQPLGFVLCTRCALPPDAGGLESDVVFIDGGNSFNPYIIADVARSFKADPEAVLGRIHVSRAFTAYQLSALILEKLDQYLDCHDAALIYVSDIASLFMDRDIPKTEAQGLFLKVCHKLADTARNRQKIVLATYTPNRNTRRGVFLDAALSGQINILIKLERRGGILRFILQFHPEIKPFELEIPKESMLLTRFMTRFMEV